MSTRKKTFLALTLLVVAALVWQADRSRRRDQRDLALYRAVYDDDVAQARRLLEQGAHADRPLPTLAMLSYGVPRHMLRDPRQWPTLVRGLRNGLFTSPPAVVLVRSADMVRLLRAHGADLTGGARWEPGALGRACALGDAALVQALLAAGVPAHRQSPVRTLLEHGAKIEVKDARGPTALAHAKRMGEPALIALQGARSAAQTMTARQQP